MAQRESGGGDVPCRRGEGEGKLELSVLSATKGRKRHRGESRTLVTAHLRTLSGSDLGATRMRSFGSEPSDPSPEPLAHQEEEEEVEDGKGCACGRKGRREYIWRQFTPCQGE